MTIVASDWYKGPLGDVLTLQRGYDLPKSKREVGMFPIVSSSGISGSHSVPRVKAPGVVTGRYGTLGEVFFLEDDYWPLNTTLYVKDFKGNNPRFLSYFLKTLNLAKQNAAGAVPGLNRNALHLLPVNLPPLQTQRKIASILSAYDDLIENNTQRIKILEEMAQTIYREWFVNFRFPGHEQVKMVDSPLGKIPEGWEVKTIQETFDILGGGTPSKKVPEYWEEGVVNWYSPTDLTGAGTMFMEESGKKITELGLKKSSARLFPANSVMMTSRATLGVIAINTTEASTNQGFITCLPNTKFPLYTLFYWLHENVEKFISLGTGATFKEISKGVFKNIEIIVPREKVVGQFEDLIAPVIGQILGLQRKNKNLRQTRDLLLPKLISGEVDVSDLEIKTKEAAA